ncbi:MAG TPA: hypothetical protein PLG02_10275, partial [Methylotenera sp.]|nr:hypothetical protein [Methylotenera sp.]
MKPSTHNSQASQTKPYWLLALSLSLMLITQTAHADFRKALDAYQKRDGDTLLKEVKDAVDKKNDDGLMLLLNAIQLDEQTSKKTSFNDNYQEKIDRSKMLSTFEIILNESQKQQMRDWLQGAVRSSTANAQYQLHFMSKLTDLNKSQLDRQKELECIANKGSFSAASELASEYSYFYASPQNYSREKAEKWFIKSAELGDPYFQFALGMKYLNYASPYFISHEECLQVDTKNKAICFAKNEAKGFYWIKQAISNYDKNKYVKRSLAYEIGNIMHIKFDTQAPNLRQAYLWYLLGINSPDPANDGVDDSLFISALNKMYESGELKTASPELDAVWLDVKKRDEMLYLKQLVNIPTLLIEARKMMAKQRPVFSYEQDEGTKYKLDVYADGKVKLLIEIYGKVMSGDSYLKVSQTKVGDFLSEINRLSIADWKLNNPLNNKNNQVCSNADEVCPTNNYFVTFNQGANQRVIYFGEARYEKNEDAQKSKRIAQVFSLVEQ